MSRPNRIWWWKARGEYAVTIDGERHRLGPDREAAEKKFHKLMAKPKRRRVASEAVVAIIDEYLDNVRRHRAPRTYASYKEFAQSFTDTISPTLPVEELRAIDLQRWINSKDWSTTTKNTAITIIKAAMKWALEMGLIETNPIAHMKKPPREKREIVVTEEEYTTILSKSRDRNFRDLVTVAWECGPRPQELIAVEARHVDLQHSRWVFERVESKGKRVQRIVYLTEEALAITKRLMLKHPEGVLFRNTKGRPWFPYAVSLRFETLKKHVGRKLCLYAFRHTWMTRLLKAGVDPITTATLAGHVDTAMLARTYAHLSNDPDHLKKALKRLVG